MTAKCNFTGITFYHVQIIYWNHNNSTYQYIYVEKKETRAGTFW